MRFVFIILIFLLSLSCEESSKSVKVREPNGSGASNKVTSSKSEQLRIGVYSLDKYGITKNANKTKNIKKALTPFFKDKVDLMVFTDVMVSATQFKKEVVNNEFVCETFKKSKKKQSKIIVCRNPGLIKMVRGNGLPEEELANNTINEVALPNYNHDVPAFHSVYEFKNDGFRFYFVAVDLISGFSNDDLRQDQLEALTSYMNQSSFLELPAVLVGNWKNNPALNNDLSGAREIDLLHESILRVFPETSLFESKLPRTKVLDGDSGLPKKYNNLFYNKAAWSEESVKSNDICADLNTEDAENPDKVRRLEERRYLYVENFSSYCTVFFNLRRKK